MGVTMLLHRALVIGSIALGSLPALAQTADKALINGKIITVDDRFTIGQAIAIRGQRVVKVGSKMIDSSLRTKLNNLKVAMKGIG